MLLGELLAGLGGDAVAEDGAVGVVGLVLEAAREQAVALEVDRLAVEAEAVDGGPVGPAAVDEGAGEGEAALQVDVEVAVVALGQGQHRVADDADGALSGGVGTVEDEHGDVLADLVGGQPDTLGGVHRRDHVGGQLGQRGVEDLDLLLRPVHDRGAPAGHRPDLPALGQGAVGRERGSGFEGGVGHVPSL